MSGPPDPGFETVPSVAEIRRITQLAKPDSRWWYRLFRQGSTYVTWVLLHTKVTPNQVTVASLVAALFGLLLLAQSSAVAALFGLLALLLYHFLDRVDGEIARIRRMFSLRGIYLDNAGHFITEPGVFLALTFRLSATADQPRLLWIVGSVGALAAVLTRVAKHAPFQLFSQYVLERPALLDGLDARSGHSNLTRTATREDRAASGESSRSLIGAARSFALSWTSFPATLSLFTVGLGFEWLGDRRDVVTWILMGAAAFRLLVYLALEVVNLTQNLAAESIRLADLRDSDD